ncbi:2-succinyl-6-hydroxy-2,4-cyclohexadiene-1-carboxylate synthase [Shewanella gelidii]|uniref:Putative 2-succinyl-6-hydroxy-2,4-cyclohexadiene-1-carboxylate synthase n=1 Tax=Shewanella gelidii TaxID=1642821 RepID=A0A917NAA3_9GAMM|nr:2-succinyl-6-hydroxy-2,4-cyclohexadiene-1-carboxylate synthase [Shewanella gelidii]MCL1098524.1 2-succinyl-6-hydroxy-2,4-cyclohexadiene-1-carboxylate synthase [Shewanella gelidii]GGI82076.1 putative 2-succinyl-6-hydroxy-2,4-cyclohexadiene-1-carboxylate synthase [Shewanella gelidii]
MLTISKRGDESLPPLVLLHGFLGNKRDWLRVLPQLSEHFHCICIDLPGHGGSYQTDLPVPGFDATSAMIMETLKALGVDKFHLHGYSLGGRIALHFARDYPQHLLSLSLESCHPGLLDEKEIAARKHNDSNWAERLITIELEDFLKKWYLQPVFADLDDFSRLRLIQDRSANKPMSLYNCFTATSLALQQDLWRVPETLPFPCRYIVGKKDKKFSALAHQWQQQVPFLEVHSVANAGHNVHLEASEAFCQLLTQQAPGRMQ